MWTSLCRWKATDEYYLLLNCGALFNREAAQPGPQKGSKKRSQCTESVQALKSCIISVKDTGLGLGLGLQGVVKQKLSYWLRRYGRSKYVRFWGRRPKMSRYNLEPLMKDVHNNEIEMYKKFQEDQTDSHGEKAKVAFWGST
ncbi:uncharacterized protein PSFLO_02851 [Pseudozyma flocculosa]|uniref:Uncharacterized protein n=2 Tax=Pseudozyma flocculosa TaxID=84751 RepID=A0A5C3EYU3_9BASI|nr:uncharacterized protein PSFLO_02851 [Pseudozyma flocculosa]